MERVVLTMLMMLAIVGMTFLTTGVVGCDGNDNGEIRAGGAGEVDDSWNGYDEPAEVEVDTGVDDDMMDDDFEVEYDN